VWGHALTKGLLFLGAGSLLHGASTRDLEGLGGLMKRMPATGALLALGAAALAALPPLGGFVSEWLMVSGLIRGGLDGRGAGGLAALFAASALALVGALAALCFARLVGVALLGQPRSDGAARAHESPAAMLAPMVFLAAASVALALQPHRVASAFLLVAGQIAPSAPLAAVTPSLALIGRCNAAVWGATVAATIAFLVATRRAPGDETWGCGYAAPTARMQYTGRSFAEGISGRLLPRPLRALTRGGAPAGLFPGPPPSPPTTRIPSPAASTNPSSVAGPSASPACAGSSRASSTPTSSTSSSSPSRRWP
jgi:NADH:ubiquinone oxidoreductase subunit 5 (subunit L)/multisubunit Na+/H+ antiporter MnhA subunit